MRNCGTVRVSVLKRGDSALSALQQPSEKTLVWCGHFDRNNVVSEDITIQCDRDKSKLRKAVSTFAESLPVVCQASKEMVRREMVGFLRGRRNHSS